MTAITTRTAPDFTGLRFERSPQGHVRTPWFSFPTEPQWSPYDMRSRYHAIIHAAKEAFADVLRVDKDYIVVTELRDNPLGEIQWRLGTAMPCRLPEPRKQIAPENRNAIDI